MKFPIWLFRLGAAGMVLTVLVIGEEPMASTLRQHPENWLSVTVLYGFPVLLGLAALALSARRWNKPGSALWIVSHSMALFTVLWIVLWCFVWLAIVSNMGEKAEMLIERVAYLHLFGVGFTMAAYFTGFMAATPGQKAARFWMACGWGASYTALFNLFLQPTLPAFWGPAIGGLTLCFAAYWLSRSLKPKVETPSPRA